MSIDPDFAGEESQVVCDYWLFYLLERRGSMRVIFLVHRVLAIPLLISMGGPAASQDGGNSIRHCLAIADVNERTDCLEGSPTFGPAILTPLNQAGRSRINLPSFDCRSARTPAERTICADATLSEWDARMGQAFQQAIRRSKDASGLLDAQRLWLSDRDKRCIGTGDNTSAPCLLEMTKQRVTALSRTTTVVMDSTTQMSSNALSPTSPLSSGRVIAIAEQPPPKNEPAGSIPTQSQNSAGASWPDSSTAGILFAAVGLGIIAIALRMLRTIRWRQLRAATQRLLDEQQEAEWQRLVTKYDEEIAARILARKVWQGMTVEQLIESWGNPADVDREIIKARTKETWKYVQTGKNRFANRIYLENGIVIGWKT